MNDQLSPERSCEESDSLRHTEKTPIEILFEPVEKRLSWFLFNINGGPKRKTLNRISKGVQYCVLALAVYISCYSFYVLSTKQLTDLTTIIFSMTICMLFTSISADVSSLHWQKNGTIRTFFRILHSASNGRGVQRHRNAMDRVNRVFGWFTWSIIVYSISFDIYLVSGYKPQGVDMEVFMNMLYFKELMIVDNALFCYLLIGQSLQVHTYCFCIRAVSCEINQFIHEAIETKCSTEEEAMTFFTHSIERNVKLSNAVRLLDNTFKRFAFIQIFMIIPNTIFVLFGIIIRRDEAAIEIFLSSIHVALCVFLFQVLTFYPAQLHAQIKKTRVLFCSNIRQWFSYGPRVHTAALLFSSHLEQNDLGVTLWGFALLSKPLILTGLSAMSTALAIFLQFSDCKKQISTAMGHHNISFVESLFDD